MKFKEWLGWKNNWPIYGLLFLFIPAFWWWGVWSGGAVLKWWRTLEGRFADPVFFEWEEFIALHSHNNEWPGRCGFYLILITGAVFLLLRLARDAMLAMVNALFCVLLLWHGTELPFFPAFGAVFLWSFCGFRLILMNQQKREIRENQNLLPAEFHFRCFGCFDSDRMTFDPTPSAPQEEVRK